MKTFVACMALLLQFTFVGAQSSLNVMSFNIRYDTPKDSANSWPFRKELAASQILFHDAHLVGVQEALHHQLEDLIERLPRFRYVGVGRDDGQQKGEYSAILFDSTRLQLLTTQTFWLSTEPGVAGSKSWDAAITRVVTWARFRDKKTRKEFYFFNTHFDHIGKVARKESAKLLIQKVSQIAGTRPTIITGDFNAIPSDEPIRVIADSSNPLRLIDARSISATPHFGPVGTFNGFTSKELANDPIDYIFVKNKVKVLKHAAFSHTWKGRFSSDHFPMFAQVVIE